MILPLPFASADDASLVEGCLTGDEDAWAMFERRYGVFVQATIVRALDVPRASEVDLEQMTALAWTQIRRDALVGWNGECQLRSYLAVVARHLTLAQCEETTSPATHVASLPTPSGLFLDDLLAIEPAARVHEAIERFPPNIAALVRLRLRGLSHGDIAATLGMSPATVRQHLERVARRLGELDANETGPLWHLQLDAGEIEDRVAHAIATEEDADYRARRALIEKTWRAVGERALGRPVPRTPVCLEPRTIAGFVDGTLRGPGRARAEGHASTCPRCTDEAAALVFDLRMHATLREAVDLDPLLAVAAACVATTRFASAERLTTRALERGSTDRAAIDLRRLGQAGRLLEGGRQNLEDRTSAVVATHLPDDHEAPLVAFEALILEDPHTAWRAIDDHMAKQTLGARLRLLAAAAGQDLDLARASAEAVITAPSVDPGHNLDARAVAALPKGRVLPREILVERLRAVLPEAVRFVLARAPG